MHAAPRRVDFTEGYHVRLQAALNRGEGRLVTLSKGGAYIATPVSLLPQAQLSVAIDIPELERTVEVEAVVAWENRGPKRPSSSHPDGYGLRFIRVPTASAEAIQWLLRRDELASDDPERTRALSSLEIQRAMAQAQARFGEEAYSVPKPTNPFRDPDGPPYRLSAAVVSTRAPRAPGVFILSYDRTLDARIGRTDEDLREALRGFIGRYAFFHYEVIPTPRARFERECELYHRLGGDRGQLDTDEHPLPPAGKAFKCPVCVKGH